MILIIWLQQYTFQSLLMNIHIKSNRTLSTTNPDFVWQIPWTSSWGWARFWLRSLYPQIQLRRWQNPLWLRTLFDLCFSKNFSAAGSVLLWDGEQQPSLELLKAQNPVGRDERWVTEKNKVQLRKIDKKSCQEKFWIFSEKNKVCDQTPGKISQWWGT